MTDYSLTSLNRPGALIAGGHFASLAVARNLGLHGISVYVVDSENCISRYSKYTKKFFLCPSTNDESKYLDFLIQLSSVFPSVKGSVLFASTDEQVRIFAQHRERLAENYIVSIPNWDTIKYFYDKRLSCTLAQQHQIPIPDTIYDVGIDDILSTQLSFPLVIKPAITSQFVHKTKKKAYKANNPQELLLLYNQVAEILDPDEIIIQEFIPGGTKNLYSYFGYFKNGIPIVGCAARRLRQHPIEFGRSSTYALTTFIPDLEVLSTRLLSGIGYTGMAEVEFMYDPKHSQFEFLEVNPRIWGWIDLSMYAGVDIPYIAYADMISKPANFGKYFEGAKWIHLATDLPTSLSEILHGKLSIKEYIWSVYGSHDAVLSIKDPIPFLAELCLIPLIVRKRGF